MSRSSVITINVIAIILLFVAAGIIWRSGIPALDSNRFASASAQPGASVQSPGQALRQTTIPASEPHPAEALSTTGLTAAATTNPGVATSSPLQSQQPAATTFLSLVNERRATRGLPEMYIQPALTDTARQVTDGSVSSVEEAGKVLMNGYLFERISQLAGNVPGTDADDLSAIIGDVPSLNDDAFTDMGIWFHATPGGGAAYTLIITEPTTLTAPGADPAAAAMPTQNAQQQAILALLNAARVDMGMEPLVVNGKLVQAALSHSEDQAQRDVLTHDGADGSSVADRTTRADYLHRIVGENVLVRGNIHATGAFDQWWNSPPHFENMMNASFTEIGIAYAASNSGQHYYTMVLGASR